LNKFLEEKVKILIVDDVELSTRTLKHLLENILTGEYDIDVLHHGDVVVDEIERNGYNLVFLDNRLPGKDGLSILKEIRQKDIDTNVIFLTGYSDEETAVKAMKLGAKDYIPKGNLDVQRLLEAINEVVLESCFILDIPPKTMSILQDHFTETNLLAPRQSLKHVFGEGQVLEKELVEALDLIFEKKGMKRKWEYSALVCPECRSTADEIKLTCPVCSSQKLVKGES
jgi:DNA-binding NarL/FixJ family response regulator